VDAVRTRPLLAGLAVPALLEEEALRGAEAKGALLSCLPLSLSRWAPLFVVAAVRAILALSLGQAITAGSSATAAKAASRARTAAAAATLVPTRIYRVIAARLLALLLLVGVADHGAFVDGGCNGLDIVTARAQTATRTARGRGRACRRGRGRD
jgi:hypothetical protein